MKRRTLYALLAGAAAVGVVAAYFETSLTVAQPTGGALDAPGAAPPPVPARPEPPGAGARQPTGNPLWAVPLTQLSMTRERPVFSPSRRPPPPPPSAPVFVAPVAPRPPPKPAEPERPTIALVGTVAAGSAGIGVFIESATRNIVRLRLGEDHQGWVLHSVERRGVTLEKDGQTAVLELPTPGGGMEPALDGPTVDDRFRRPGRQR
jgi:general secretion pathway protein N